MIQELMKSYRGRNTKKKKLTSMKVENDTAQTDALKPLRNDINQ